MRVGLPHKRRQIDCGLYGEEFFVHKGNLRGKKKSIIVGETNVYEGRKYLLDSIEKVYYK